MEDVLSRMKEEKRIKIINSAMKEFGANSFDKASTNVIVKEAGISKGLLYHYFDSKKTMFDYLIVFTLRTIGDTIADKIEWDDGDLINRMHKVMEIKLGIFEKYPFMLDFGKIMYASMSLEDIKKMAEQYMPDLYLKVYSQNINYSLFKDDLDVSRAVKMIQFFLDGYSEQFLQKFKRSVLSTNDIKKEMKELKKYLVMYKEAFYK